MTTAPAELTMNDRLRWTLRSTLGPQSLASGVLSSAWGTGFDSPKEYDTNWGGFGKRYGLRLTGVATSNVMEASLGALWREDPRYFRQGGREPKKRIWRIVQGTFLAQNDSGRLVPAYARFAAIGGSNFLSSTWRPDSQNSVSNALLRISFGFLGRMAGNAFAEFYPDFRQRVLRR
jgi:hypothetical protein